jgi:3-deoxy-D-manno-octulosonic-acid transferase
LFALLLNAVYVLLLVALAPWLAIQAIRKGKYREGYAEKLLGLVPVRSGDETCVWFHAVSVGEAMLLEPLLTEIRRRKPDWVCVVSTTTKTGYALARSRHPDLTVFYCPLDFSWAVNRAMRRLRPNVLALVELELWPNLIRAAKKHGARTAIVNGRLGEKSFRGYRRLRPLVRRLFQSIDLIAAQNEEYAERFRALGAPAERVVATGSIKFDGAQTDRNNPATERLKQLAGIAEADVVFLAGSTQHPEESLALETYKQLSPEWPKLRLIVVPRHPERFDEAARLLDESGLVWQRRSQLEIEGSNPAARALLVDAVGELGAWWGAAQIAFVGGSLCGRGGQNMIEPAAYGAAVCFGPNTWNFREVVGQLLACGAATVVADGAALTQFVVRSLAEPDRARSSGRLAAEFVISQQGATSRTTDRLIALAETVYSAASHRRAA